MFEVPVVNLLTGVIVAPLLALVALAFRRFTVTSQAQTVPEVLARALCTIGCMGRALDHAIVLYRREHGRLRLASEVQRVKVEEAAARKHLAELQRASTLESTAVSKPIRAKVLTLFGAGGAR